MQHRVSDLFHLQMGKTPSRNQSEYWESGSNKWVSISDLSNCSMYTAETKEAITDCAVRETNIRLVPKNTVIMSFKLSIGKTAITSEPVYTNEAIMAFINKDEELVLPEFLYYQLLSKDWGSAGNRAVMGTTLNKASLSQMKIYVPSLQKQQDIVQILSHIDSQLKKTNESVNNLNDLVKSRFVEMFGALEPSVSISDACIEFIDGDWIESKDQSESGIRLIQTGNIGNGDFRDKRNRARYISEQTFEQLKCHEVYANDVLISRLPDPVGRACIVPSDAGRSITAVDCSIVRLKKEWEPSFFVSYTMTKQYEHQIQSYLTGTTRKRISRSNLGKTKIPAASFVLQQEFATFVAQVDKLRFELARQCTSCVQL